jgi:glycosyltransferase involved in cell wall biosynthesis
MEGLTVGIIANRIATVPTTGFGGIERFLASLIPGLQDLGVRVVLFSVEGSTLGDEIVPLAEARLNRDYTEYLEMSTAQVGKAYELISQRRDIDLVHGNTGFEALHAWTVDKESAVTLHNGYIQARTYGREFVDKVTNFALTQSDLANLRSEGLPVRDYIYYDIDTRYLLEQFRWQQPEKKLLYMARRTPFKGLKNAVEVTRRLIHLGFKLYIAGPPVEEQYESWYATEIAPYIDGINIIDVKVVNDAQKPAFFRGAYGFFQLNQCYGEEPWIEPFGAGPVESMATGTSVIGTHGKIPNRVGAMRELVRAGNIFFTESDEETVEKAIEAVLSLDHSPQAFQERQSRAREFLPGTAARRYKEAYLRILNA